MTYSYLRRIPLVFFLVILINTLAYAVSAINKNPSITVYSSQVWPWHKSLQNGRKRAEYQGNDFIEGTKLCPLKKKMALSRSTHLDDCTKYPHGPFFDRKKGLPTEYHSGQLANHSHATAINEVKAEEKPMKIVPIMTRSPKLSIISKGSILDKKSRHTNPLRDFSILAITSKSIKNYPALSREFIENGISTITKPISNIRNKDNNYPGGPNQKWKPGRPDYSVASNTAIKPIQLATTFYGQCTIDMLHKYERAVPDATTVFDSYGALIIPDPKAIAGSWQVILARSDPIDLILEKLGISRIRRKAIDGYPITMDIRVTWPNGETSPPFMDMVVHFPLNNDRFIKSPADCVERPIQEPDTGRWNSRLGWFQTSYLHITTGTLGTLYDRRAILSGDPSLGIAGPLQLQIWSFIPANSPKPISAIRLLKKIT